MKPDRAEEAGDALAHVIVVIDDADGRPVLHAFSCPARRTSRSPLLYDCCGCRRPSYQDIRPCPPACFGRYADRQRERHRRAERLVVRGLDAAALAFDNGPAYR